MPRTKKLPGIKTRKSGAKSTTRNIIRKTRGSKVKRVIETGLDAGSDSDDSDRITNTEMNDKLSDSESDQEASAEPIIEDNNNEEPNDDEFDDDLEIDDEDRDLEEDDHDTDSEEEIECLYADSEEELDDDEGNDEEESGEFVPDSQRRTKRKLFRYEYVRCVRDRTEQIIHESKKMIKNCDHLTPIQIAKLEILRNTLPFYIIRTLSNGKKERWSIEELDKSHLDIDI